MTRLSQFANKPAAGEYNQAADTRTEGGGGDSADVVLGNHQLGPVGIDGTHLLPIFLGVRGSGVIACGKYQI